MQCSLERCRGCVPRLVFWCRWSVFVWILWQFVCLFLAWMFWDAKLWTFYFPLLFMRSDWRTQCVDAAVNWPLFNFIHFNRCIEAGFNGLWILMLFPIFYCTAGKLKRCWNLRGPFTLSFNCDGFEVVNCNSVVVDHYIVSFDMTDRCCFWKMVLCWFGRLGRVAWSKLICCFNAEYRWTFFAWDFLRGVRADKTMDAL